MSAPSVKKMFCSINVSLCHFLSLLGRHCKAIFGSSISVTEKQHRARAHQHAEENQSIAYEVDGGHDGQERGASGADSGEGVQTRLGPEHRDHYGRSPAQERAGVDQEDHAHHDCKDKGHAYGGIHTILAESKAAAHHSHCGNDDHKDEADAQDALGKDELPELRATCCLHLLGVADHKGIAHEALKGHEGQQVGQAQKVAVAALWWVIVSLFVIRKRLRHLSIIIVGLHGIIFPSRSPYIGLRVLLLRVGEPFTQRLGKAKSI